MAPPPGLDPSPTLVYDGDCDFCERCADWIAARLPANAVVVSSQEADLSGLGLNEKQASTAAWWIDNDGTHHRGPRAIAAALVACGGPWRRLGRLLTVPGISLLAAAVYELVARNRHRLGCRNCLEKSRRGGPAFD